MSIIEMAKGTVDFLDDCVAMVEALRCMKDKGAADVTAEGVTLAEAVFDSCFPGIEWEPITLPDGTDIGLEVKRAEYRGFSFDAIRDK